MKTIVRLLFCIIISNSTKAQQTSNLSNQFKEDFSFFWETVNTEYAYFFKKQTDWLLVKEKYTKELERIQTREEFISLTEKALYEIYDHHAILNTNTQSSFRLVPSGSDIWAEYRNGKAVITELRKGFGAEACGIKPGMHVIAVNDIPIEQAIIQHLPVSIRKTDDEVKSCVLRLLLAGKHNETRKFTLANSSGQKEYYPDQRGAALEHISYTSLLESKQIGHTGYIRINDCLYNNDLIPAFDSVMQAMNATDGLIIDLRETPSGGNTSVARAILGWFINKEIFYQKHEYYAEEKSTGIKRSWEEIVSPRKGKYYAKPLVILCNHWTGSIAEGITIGFDALHRPNTKIIGTAMAGLNGAVYSFEMPNTKIHFGFPAERLYHVNGLPREDFFPSIIIDPAKEQIDSSPDQFISKALQYLKK